MRTRKNVKVTDHWTRQSRYAPIVQEADGLAVYCTIFERPHDLIMDGKDIKWFRYAGDEMTDNGMFCWHGRS